MIHRLLALVLTAGSANAFDLTAGKPFPEIPLPTASSGEVQSITDFRGQKLMLHVFASW